ncbi:outer membrane lipoprotein carrier protein LolA [Draconibacterium sp. IB214405]|uniref:LolA family protein n=1 Tax=Draconibacterium sp. IB214405 TaxID=3097352 RepID=UPI002A11E8AA|nr:outer membrane lipoprotein carrier protein LolA [Draconibacterium sp. IB214405]MDX8339319.1 outer membrane lipoprotein carrier protein LolA [Draconibacterium sp. IB214405]
MKRIVLVVALVAFTLSGWAQEDAKAKEILNEVSAKTKEISAMSASFVFSLVNEEIEVNDKFDGNIKIKGQKYCVQLPDMGVEVFSDGTTIWNYMEDGNQVTISNIDDESSELMDPSSLFSIYERGFRSEFVDEKTEGGKTLYHINLFPDSDTYDVTKIEVAIDKASMMIHSATLYSTDGNLYSILVKQMNTKAAFTDADFVFDASKHDDVEIIDFR